MRRLVVLSLILLCVLTAAAYADSILYLTPPTGNYLGPGAGGTRGDLVTMTGNYTLTSIGIQGAIDANTQMTFHAYVYDGTGSTQLAAGQSVKFTGDGTEQWFDLPISFTLLAGQKYDIGIDFESFNASNWQVHYYFFSDQDPPFSVGPFTVTDGEESHCGACNVFSPNLRLNGGGAGVPEPGTLVMLGTGALGLAGALKRKLVG